MKNFVLFLALMCAPLVACANPDYVQKEKTTEAQCDVYFEKLEACAKINWKNPEISSAEAPFTFQIVHSDNPAKLELLKSAKLEVVLWMPAMGHGSSPTEVKQVDDLTYDVSRVYFIMGGEWEIRFKFTNKDTGQTIDTGVSRINI